MKKGRVFLVVLLLAVAWLIPSPLGFNFDYRQILTSITDWKPKETPTQSRTKPAHSDYDNIANEYRKRNAQETEQETEPGNGNSLDDLLKQAQEKKKSGEKLELKRSAEYVLNKNTHKFHYPTCPSVGQMKESNKWYYSGTREEIIAMGYEPCGRCHP